MVNNSFFSVKDENEHDCAGEEHRKDNPFADLKPDDSEWTYGEENSSSDHSIIDLNMQNYMTLPRTKLDFFSIKNYLK